jgi:hypothetical protein
MSTDLAPSQPSRQALEAKDRSAPRRVTGRLRTAILEMVWKGSRRDDAAKAAAMSVHGLREALRKPHVKSFLLHELEVLRTSERARNVFALVDVRDNSQNAMARVSAARSLELLAETDENNVRGGRSAAAATVPGICIVIERLAPMPAPANAVVIEHDPARPASPASDREPELEPRRLPDHPRPAPAMLRRR